MPYSIRPPSAGSDTVCPDGFPCYGWRQIHRGGYVRWYGGKYYNDELDQWAGMWVYITIADWLAIELEVWDGVPGMGDTPRIAKMPYERLPETVYKHTKTQSNRTVDQRRKQT